jgi:hypothetical protein
LGCVLKQRQIKHFSLSWSPAASLSFRHTNH